MSGKRKVALVGIGRMGRNHLRVLREHPGFELVAVVDSAAPAPGDLGSIPFLRSVKELAKFDFDAAIVATPTATHSEVAMELVAMKKHLLVEKPLASTYDQAVNLVRASNQAGIKLVVGHVERFNPAVRKLREVITNGWLGTPIHFSFTRVGGYPDTIMAGNNVLLDLAVHDIDVLRGLMGPLKLESSTCHATWREGVLDTAEIFLLANTGASASVHVNWITPTKIRTIRVTGTRGVCFVDYILQTCEMLGGSLLKAIEPSVPSFEAIQDLYRTTDRIQFGVQKVEPLRAQADQFKMLLNTGELGELCSGSDAISAVMLAERATVRKAAGPKSLPPPTADHVPAPTDEWV